MFWSPCIVVKYTSWWSSFRKTSQDQWTTLGATVKPTGRWRRGWQKISANRTRQWQRTGQMNNCLRGSSSGMCMENDCRRFKLTDYFILEWWKSMEQKLSRSLLLWHIVNLECASWFLQHSLAAKENHQWHCECKCSLYLCEFLTISNSFDYNGTNTETSFKASHNDWREYKMVKDFRKWGADAFGKSFFSFNENMLTRPHFRGPTRATNQQQWGWVSKEEKPTSHKPEKE